MIKFQQTYTTPEQSQRLLDLGVPADSADCHYTAMQSIIWVHNNNDPDFTNKLIMPCWSVGRLIEIVFICSEARTIDFWRNDSPMYDIIYEFENNKMDFSKLED